MDEAVEALEDLLVVGDGDDAGLLLGREAPQEIHDELRPRAVERRRGFVGEDDGRVERCAGFTPARWPTSR